MKPYGLRPKFNYNGYQDRRPHPHSKYVNWWEVELNPVKSKKTERFAGKKVVKEEIDDQYDMIFGDDDYPAFYEACETRNDWNRFCREIDAAKETGLLI